MPRHSSGFDRRWAATPLRRRSVLVGMGAAGAAALLPGCQSKTQQPPPPPTATVFDHFRAVRDLVRSSPDHLAARAAEVIASQDFTRAVRFVRDQIAVVPPAHSYELATDAVRWGPDAALRAGAGTLRERAELLKAMLTAMGATASVKQASWPAGVDAAALYRARPPRFTVEPSALNGGATLPAAFARANEPFPDSDQAALMTALLARLPTGQAVARQPFDGVGTIAPVVEYSVGAATKWAFAMAELDEVTTEPTGLGSALSPPVYPKAYVRLLAAMGDLPGVPNAPGLVELAKGTWTTDQLAGSRLLVTTSAPDPDNAVGTPRDQLTVRVPVMTVQPATPLLGTDPLLWTPKAAPTAAPAGGNPFTLSGARFAPGAQPSDPPVGPYGPVVQLDASTHSTALAKVASLEAVVNGGTFPDVQLTLSALDAGGAPVFGLTQADFALTDEGTAQAATLLSNAGVDQLKVMLSYDCSGSVTWPSPADKTAFDDALAAALVSSAQASPYLLGVASVGGAPLGGFVAPDATGIKAAIASCSSFSDIWATLGQIAPVAGCSAVVVVSDFQASDDPAAIPALQRRLRASGLAVALVPVAAADQNTISALVSTCGAVVLDPLAADFQARLTSFVSSATSRAKASGYRLSYRVPADQQASQTTRTAKVSLASNAAIAASAAYPVPAAAARGSLGIAGLYLELEVAGSVTTTRRLAGPGLDRFGTPLAATADDYAATRELLSGVVTIAFEPGSPTTAANAEDLLACGLSLEPLLAACEAGKTQREGLVAARAVQVYSGVLAALVEPPPPTEAGPLVAPPALRVMVLSESAGYHGFSRRVDVVPDLNVGVAATTDAAAAFTAAMRSTLRLSLREALLLPSSAAGMLAGATLQYLAPNGDPSTLTGFAPADLAKWSRVFDQYSSWHRLVPTSPTVEAMWLVDPNTGATVAVFLDGSGGGADCRKAEWNAGIQEALAVLQIYIAARALACEEPGAAPWACLGAVVGSVFAGVAALFAAALLDGISGIDIMLMIISLVGGALPGIGGPVGLVVAIMATAVVNAEVAQSLNDHC